MPPQTARKEKVAGKGVVVHSLAIAARKALGLSQAEFAKLLGVSVRTFWELDLSGLRFFVVHGLQSDPCPLRD